MQFSPPLTPAILLRRYKRFLADVLLDSQREVTVHCPNPGSMLGCMVPLAPVLLSHHPSPRRKLAYTLEILQLSAGWVGINPQRGNQLVEESLREGPLNTLFGCTRLQREVALGQGSRLDFRFDDHAERPCYMEVKYVTLTDDSTAYFPDSVTRRGARHLRVLTELAATGHRAMLLYVVNHPEARRVRPADRIDPEYGQVLRKAARQGVEILAYRNTTTEHSQLLTDALEVDLSPASPVWAY